MEEKYHPVMRYRKIEGGKLQKFIQPMMAKLTDRPPFDSPDWLFEVKWDGYRAVAEVNKEQVMLYSRNGLSFARAYAKVYQALKELSIVAVLDGEIVVFDRSNKPDFQKLQNYENNSMYTIQYLVFDCLSINKNDVTSLPLIERKRLLKDLLPEHSVVRFCDHVVEEGKMLYAEIEKAGFEGIIAKRKNSLYHKGKRTSNWLKIKNVKSEEAVIVGFTTAKGSRTGFGSLLLAQYRNRKLVYVGNVGTGFTQKTLIDLSKQLTKSKRTTSSLDENIKPPPDTTWVDPILVCNVKFSERTNEGLLRHPVFQGLRVDKKPGEVKAEKNLRKIS